jgi:folylpolyglutamate synthase/dihydropteroate synthase
MRRVGFGLWTRFHPEAVAVIPSNRKPSRAVWSDRDYSNLVAIHAEDIARSNLTLAQMCSVTFGQEITVNAIKGSLNRLRWAGRIPRYRPD